MNMANAILRQQELQKRLGVSGSTIWYWVNPKDPRYDPTFPKPFKLSDKGRAVGWVESEIDAWIEQRAAVRIGG